MLSTVAMNEILEIDPVNRIAVVQPGVINSALAAAARDAGLRYPPDPGSWESSTIGGNVATNAGGMCCVKYGVTAEYVLGLEVVLASGEVLRTGRRTAKGVAGYDLTRLFVGSEGTLGIITSVTIALRPPADESLTLIAVFPTTAAAGEAVAAISSGGLSPSLLELLDQTHLRAIEALRPMGLRTDAKALLLAVGRHRVAGPGRPRTCSRPPARRPARSRCTARPTRSRRRSCCARGGWRTRRWRSSPPRRTPRARAGSSSTTSPCRARRWR